MRRWLDALLAVLLAPPCAACTRPLDRPTFGPVCDSCWNSILPLTPPLCDVCGDALPSWRTVSVPLARCARCRRLERPVSKARAIGAYDGALRGIIHAFKYDGRRTLARPLAAIMRSRGSEVLSGADAVVPVPLHPSRRRSRGFNQAEDLARALGCRVIPALTRVRETKPQAGLPAAQRHGNVKDAFEVTRHVSGLIGTTVVVVDDVYTTGATLDACAVALKAAGVRQVRALTAGRALTARR